MLDDILQGHTNEDELNTVETDTIEESPALSETSKYTELYLLAEHLSHRLELCSFDPGYTKGSI